MQVNPLRTAIVITKLRGSWYASTYLNDLDSQNPYIVSMESSCHGMNEDDLPAEIGETKTILSRWV